jgi:hypothetical protein
VTAELSHCKRLMLDEFHDYSCTSAGERWESLLRIGAEALGIAILHSSLPRRRAPVRRLVATVEAQVRSWLTAAHAPPTQGSKRQAGGLVRLQALVRHK